MKKSIMTFGSGVLVAALTFSLVEETFSLSQSIPPVVIGFILGGISYSVANSMLDKSKRSANTSISRISNSDNTGTSYQTDKRNRKKTAGGGNSVSGLITCWFSHG